VPILLPRVQESKVVKSNETSITKVNVTVNFTGDIIFYINTMGEDVNEGAFWEYVGVDTTGSGIALSYSPTNNGTRLKWKAVLSPGAIITRIRIEDTSA